jgi:hypothetical protein
MRTTTVLAAALTVLALAGCGTAATVHPSASPSAGKPVVPVVKPSAATSAAPGTSPYQPVSAVPGSHDNSYVAGPFTVTMTAGITRLPSAYDKTTQAGQSIPAYGSVIVVKDTGGYTGWVMPQVEYVIGHSLAGRVIDTENGSTPEYQCGECASDTLAPGQSETLYAQYQGSYVGYVTAQLTSASYGPPGSGTLAGTIVQFRYGS